jgi:hypothetical protein
MKKSILALLFFFANSLICIGQQIPEFFGVYLVADGRLIELKENNIRIRTPSKGGMQEDGVAGLRELSKININDAAAHLIIFLENFDINSIKLSKLRYASTESLVSIPIIGNAEKVMTNINMWVLEKNIPFRTGPIEGKKGMYKIAPSAGFEPGVYALHQGGIRRSRIQGGQLGILMESEEYGNTAFDFSFNFENYKGALVAETPTPDPTIKLGETNENAAILGKQDLAVLLKEVLQKIEDSRKHAEYIHQAMQLISIATEKKYDVEASIKQGVDKCYTLINDARNIYIAGKPFASIKASLKEKEAIKILKDIIKKIEN